MTMCMGVSPYGGQSQLLGARCHPGPLQREGEARWRTEVPARYIPT